MTCRALGRQAELARMVNVRSTHRTAIEIDATRDAVHQTLTVAIKKVLPCNHISLFGLLYAELLPQFLDALRWWIPSTSYN